jgi:hypothetical protein
MNFGDIWAWIVAHPKEVAEGYLAIVGLASWIVKLTPTLKDDNILLWLVKIIGKWIAVDKYGPAEVKRPTDAPVA